MPLWAHPVDPFFTPEATYAQLQARYPFIELARVASAAGVVIERNRIYRDDLNRPLHVDVFLPANKAPRPGVLLVHGGGWKSGSHRHQQPMATYIANRGLVAVTVEYRLSPGAGYPAGMEDLVQALGWMRRHAAELGLDAERIAVLGCSSGAQMATLLGVTAGADLPLSWLPTPAPVQAIVNIDGIVSFASPLALRYENDPARHPSAAEACSGGGRFEEVPAL